MAFTPIVDTCKIEMLYSNSDLANPIVNVMHARCGSAPIAAYLGDIADCFSSYVTSLTENVLPSTTIMETITVTDLNSETGAQVVLPVGIAGGDGTVGAGGACALLRMNTAIRGRSYRGRNFVGPLVYGAVLNNAIAGGTVTDIETYFATLQADLAALSPPSTVTIASRILGLSTDVLTASVESVPAYQRRRTGR